MLLAQSAKEVTPQHSGRFIIVGSIIILLLCWHKATDITHQSPGGERHGKRKCSTIFLERQDRAVVNHMNIEIVSKAMLGNLLTDEVECHGLFQVHRYHLELNYYCCFLPHQSWQLLHSSWMDRTKPRTHMYVPRVYHHHCSKTQFLGISINM